MIYTFKSFFLFFLCSLIPLNVSGEDRSYEWFSKRCLFPLLEYDLLEVQPYAGMHLIKAENVMYDGVYIPVNIAFRKSALQWEMLNMRFDLAIGVGAYTQFEIIRFDENTLRGGLLNTDFKASGFLFGAKGNHNIRMQLFHISSHLGDDYMLRNNDFTLNNKSVNYEQLDVTYLYNLNAWDIYGGMGVVINANAYRDRFMWQIGFQTNIPIKPKIDLSFGGDIKVYEENDFIPDAHAAIGISLKQRDRQQVNFSLDGFIGNLPYSTLDFGKVFWIGLSTRVYL